MSGRNENPTQAGLLHDIKRDADTKGYNKTARLTEDEFEEIKLPHKNIRC